MGGSNWGRVGGWVEWSVSGGNFFSPCSDGKREEREEGKSKMKGGGIEQDGMVW